MFVFHPPPHTVAMSSSGSDLNLVDMNLTEVPVDIANQAGSLATTLNLSENQLWYVP